MLRVIDSITGKYLLSMARPKYSGEISGQNTGYFIFIDRCSLIFLYDVSFR
jgi:hypothetical protein